MNRLLAILTLASAPAFAQVWWATNEITGVVGPSDFLTFGAGPMRVTLTAHDGGVPVDLSEETVRLIVQDRGDMKAVYSNVATRVSGSTYRGEATLAASTNQYDVRMVLFPQGDPINFYPIYWARVTVTSIPETVTLNSLGNVLLNASNNLVAPAAASNTVLTAMGDGTVKFEPAASGGGGPTTGQVNRIRINGTNYQGDLDWVPAGLLRLAPTGLTINAYVGTEDVFAGLQSYASPLTNVIAWNLGGQPVGMSPLVPGYQLTTDGSNWYLGADAAGTAVATNAIYQLGHNGTIVGPLNTALFDSPFAVTALGGGTARVSIVEQPGIQLMVGSTNGLVITTTQNVWQTCTYLDQEIIDGSAIYDPTSCTFSITSGIYECTFQATPTNGNAASFQSRVMVGGTQTLHKAGAYRPELSALSKNGFAAGYYNTSTGTVSRSIIFPIITTTTINGLVFQIAHEQQGNNMKYKDMLATLRYVGPVQ